MTAYLVRRILQAIPTIIGVTLISFILMHAAPGDPVQILFFSPGIEPEELERKRTELCLDRPLWFQYTIWVVGDWSGECPQRGLIRGDFGTSFTTKQPVLESYLQLIPGTVQLTLYALIIGGLFGLFLGIISAINRGGAIDNISRLFSVVFDALPSFWFGILLIMVFSVRLGWLPAGGRVPLNVDDPTIWDYTRHLIMPSVVLGVGWIALMSRFMRAETLEVMNQDYIRTAHAKGLKRRTVYFRHAARNALIPIVTILGPAITSLLSGAVVVERIFSWPGIGRFLVDAVSRRDFPIVMASAVIGAVLVIIGNLLSDVLLVLVDPRVRLS
ncbi:MAG: ABC transporter permease [Chloroflexota bacterium]